VIDELLAFEAALLIPLVVALAVSVVYRVALGKVWPPPRGVHAVVVLSGLAFLLLRFLEIWNFPRSLSSSDKLVSNSLSIGAAFGYFAYVTISRISLPNVSRQ